MSQIAEKKFPCVMLLGGLSKLKPPKKFQVIREIWGEPLSMVTIYGTLAMENPIQIKYFTFNYSVLLAHKTQNEVPINRP